jgi:hypothetical protein
MKTALTAPHRKFATHALVALALLISQWVAQAHAFSHLRQAGDVGNAPATQTQLCAECLAGAPLFAAVGTPGAAFSFLAVCPERLDGIRTVSLVEQVPCHAFRSRAPPFFV